MAATSTQYDIIIFGATSFVGDIITGYMMERYGVGGEISWAVAGRSESKLLAVKDKHQAGAVPHIIADAADKASLTAMALQAKVVMSTVGPYALYGEPLVKVCAEEGVDYCDLTGEIQWYKRMVDRYEETAKKSGARIMHCSGFDSIPSDLGVFYLQQQAKDAFGETCQQVDARVARIKGGASGGTLASMTNIAKEAASDPALRRLLKNPYSICPEGHGFTAKQRAVTGAEMDEDHGAWMGPFLMEAINSRVVHRSNALLDALYGNDFLYCETMLTGKGPKGKKAASRMATGLKWFMVMAALGPTRWVMEKFFLTKPGDGPTPTEQQEGMFDIRFTGRTVGGRKITTKVTGDRDPGYGSTSKMISEAAICLSRLDKKQKAGGFWTPASALGASLIERLSANAGLTFEVTETQ